MITSERTANRVERRLRETGRLGEFTGIDLGNFFLHLLYSRNLFQRLVGRKTGSARVIEDLKEALISHLIGTGAVEPNGVTGFIVKYRPTDFYLRRSLEEEEDEDDADEE